jgi:hypothetical protein
MSEGPVSFSRRTLLQVASYFGCQYIVQNNILVVTMKAQEGVEVGGQLHVPPTIPSGKKAGTHCAGGWVGPKAGMDGCRKSRSHRDSIPGPELPQPTT